MNVNAVKWLERSSMVRKVPSSNPVAFFICFTAGSIYSVSNCDRLKSDEGKGDGPSFAYIVGGWGTCPT